MLGATVTLIPPTERVYAVVLNAQAGRGLALREWPRLKAELERRHLRYTLVQEADGAAALARVQALAPGTAVMALGGEGTVRALLPALVDTGRPLAVIPLGTGNDFAGMLRLRPGQFGEALDRLRHTPRQVDALDVRLLAGDNAGSRHLLLNGLGLGFDAQVTANMTRAPASLRGLAQYAWGAALSVRELTLTEVRVEVDGQLLYGGPSALAAAMNGTRYGGGFLISPESDPRDGRLNVLVSGPVNRSSLIHLMALVLRGRHLGHPAVHHGAGQHVRIRWERPVPVHLDGDLHGQVQELTAEVLPGAVTLLNA